jgi:hypothetical protein
MDRVGDLTAIDQRGRELHYLTEHYQDLQGLVQVPVWALVMLVMWWADAVGRARGLRMWALWILATVVGLAVAKLSYWTKDWYERCYGVVWTAEDEVGESEPLSLLHGEDEAASKRREVRRRRRWLLVIGIAAAFYLPAMWLHGGNSPLQAGWIGYCFLFAMPGIFLWEPVLLGPSGGFLLARWRWCFYAAAVLALLGFDLMNLLGRMNGTWSYSMVGGLMLVVSLQDHWLFTRLLGGSKARGGCDE